jgi:DNA polymerase delta subunit 1
MISHNISHDTFLERGCAETGEELDFHLDLGRTDASTGERTSTLFEGRASAAYVRTDVREGVVPRILRNLLSERKRVRGLIKSEPDAFKKAVLDGLQLAFKVTANSLYGQLGAPTSPVFKPELAASTTAVGRQMLEKLRRFATDECSGKVVYGDTDSVFITFPQACTADDPRERLAASIACGEACSTAFRALVPQPHNAEYEKTFWPFVLLSKKRYVGNMYEQPDSMPMRKSMGIVLRRRDNADIVKRIYGGVIDRVMTGDVADATAFARGELLQLVNGGVDIGELTVTKTLRAESAYVDADKIAHVVLARRMNDREPGSAPAVGERMPYVYIEAPDAKLQGDRVEHPDYVGTKKIDVMFYITNQLTKPLTQLFEVLIDHVPGARAKLTSDPKLIKKEVHRAVFEPAVNDATKARAGLQSITSFFARK